MALNLSLPAAPRGSDDARSHARSECRLRFHGARHRQPLDDGAVGNRRVRTNGHDTLARRRGDLAEALTREQWRRVLHGVNGVMAFEAKLPNAAGKPLDRAERKQLADMKDIIHHAQSAIAPFLDRKPLEPRRGLRTLSEVFRWLIFKIPSNEL